MDQLKPAPEETAGTALRKGRLGVAGVVFFVVAAAAPLVGMTGAVPVAIVLGNGAAVPGAYVAVGITLLLFSVGYAAMSHRVTNTGAFFAYVGRGLGIGPGVGSAFVSLVAYLAVQLAIFGFFGAVASAELADKISIDWPWYVVEPDRVGSRDRTLALQRRCRRQGARGLHDFGGAVTVHHGARCPLYRRRPRRVRSQRLLRP